MGSLTSDQHAFLRECNLEFSERYTTADPDFKKIHESDIPTPPIVFPWYGRSRFNNRERFGFNSPKSGEEYNRRHGFRDNYDRNDGSSSREQYSHHKRGGMNSEGSTSYTQDNRRFRPY